MCYSRALCTLGALAAGFGWSCYAQAALGEDADSVTADQVRLQAKLQLVRNENHTIHELQLPTGGRVRQFVGDGDVVQRRLNVIAKLGVVLHWPLQLIQERHG